MSIKLAVAALALLGAGTAHAGPGPSVAYYTDRAAFSAALSASVTEDFTDTTLVSGLSYVTNAGNINSGLFKDRFLRGGAQTTFSFGGGVNGFGANIDESPGGFAQGILITLNFSDGGSFQLPQLDNYTGGFFGVISTGMFGSALMTAGNGSGSAETYTLDNLQFGVAGAGVPEPASWALLIAGFGLTGAAMRRRARTAVAA